MGGVSLLGPVTIVLFTVGMGVALYKWRDWRYFVLPVSVAIGLEAVAVTVDWGENRRGIIALPMVFAAAGLGGDALWRLAERHVPRFQYRYAALPAVVLAALVSVVAWNIYTYFWSETSHPVMRHAYAYDLSIVSCYVNSLGDEPYVYFYADAWRWGYEARKFYAPGIEDEDRSKRFGVFKLDHNREDEVLYVLFPPYVEQIEELKECYPDGEQVNFMDGERLVFTAYRIEADGTEAASLD